MPRAPQLNELDPADCLAAAKYLHPRFQKFTTAGDALKLNGTMFHNEKSNSNYGVAISSVKPDGSVHVYVSEAGLLLHATRPVEWLVLLNPNGSDALLVPWSAVSQSITTPTFHGGAVRLYGASNGWTCVGMNFAWLKGAIARAQVPKGKGEEGFLEARAVTRAVTEDFCHLHVHSMYSCLDGVSTPEGLVQRAVENGQPGLALTDHGYLFGSYKFYKAAKEAGIKPVLGCEFYLVDDVNRRYVDSRGSVRRFEYHITVLAQTDEGWFNICKMASLASRDHNYYVPRIDHRMLFENNAGLIVLSGCFKGCVAWHMQEYGSFVNDQGVDMTGDAALGLDGRPIYQRNPDRSLQVMMEYKRVFGDRYYAEVHNNDYQRYMNAMPSIIELARHAGVPLVVAADAHYETAEDAVLQSLLSRVGKGSVADGLGGERMTKGCYFMRTAQEMNHPAFSPDMLSRTCEVMQRCNVHIPLAKSEYYKGDADFKYLFPAYDYTQDKDWTEYQAHLAKTGAA